MIWWLPRFHCLEISFEFGFFVIVLWLETFKSLKMQFSIKIVSNMKKIYKINQQQQNMKSNQMSNVVSKYKHIPMVWIVWLVWCGFINYLNRLGTCLFIAFWERHIQYFFNFISLMLQLVQAVNEPVSVFS